MATCPSCNAALRPAAPGRGACPSCGTQLDFLEVEGRPCSGCGATLAFAPGQEALRCSCGAWQAADERRPVEGRATCPRCGRRIGVPLQAATARCPHCLSTLALG